MKKIALIACFAGGIVNATYSQVITSLSTPTYLNNPISLAVKNDGTVYFGQFNSYIIRINPTGNQSVVAGTGTSGYNGDNIPATIARVNNPNGLCTDVAGRLYIVDCYNARIRKINAGDTILTIAGNGTPGYSGDGGPALSAQVGGPHGVATDPSGNVYIADASNHRIRKVTAATGIITTVAGTGVGGFGGDGGLATLAQINSPHGLAVDAAGNIYIADSYNNRIRKVSTSGIITTFAGDGTAGYNGDTLSATAARLNQPWGVAADLTGQVYIADYSNHRIRKVSTSGIIISIAGNGWGGYSGDLIPAVAAAVNMPTDIAVDSQMNVYIADYGNARVRKISIDTIKPYIAITASKTNLCSGGTVSFKAIAINQGITPLYQWKVNGTVMGSNADTFTYVPSNNDHVACSVTSSNAYASPPLATSSAITITVTPTLTPTISISTPSSTVCSGSFVLFQATTSNGGSTPSYSWRINGVTAGYNSNIMGYTPANGDVITCIFTSQATCNTVNPVTSNPISIVVNPTVTPAVTVSANPGTSICAGGSVTFTTTAANGGSAPVYQWKKNGIPVGTNSPTYQDNSLTNGNTILCELQSNAVCATTGIFTSNALNISIVPQASAYVAISASPGTTICSGSSVLFSAIPVNAGTIPTYQWKKNGLNVGTNSTTYVDNSLLNGDLISCSLASSYGCLTSPVVNSNSVTMMVNQLVTPAVSIAASTGNMICANTPVTFSASTSNGTTVVGYAWRRNGIVVGTSANYSNSTLSNGDSISLMITTVPACAITTNATSNVIIMSVQPAVAPGITISANPGTNITPGQAVTITAAPNNGGTVPLFQWTKNGTNVGTNSATYSTASLMNGDQIRVILTSSAQCASPAITLSNTLTMRVSSGFAATGYADLLPILFPNPSAGTFRIKAYLPINFGEARILVRAFTGQVVYNCAWQNVSGLFEQEISLPSSISSGQYVVELSVGRIAYQKEITIDK